MSLSLDQDRGHYDDENLFLIDIIPQSKDTISDIIGNKEYYKNLFIKLFSKLSRLEKNVFILYTYRYSYDEMKFKINKVNKVKGLKRKVNIKSIDNALSRVKIKAKEIFEKYEEE